MVKQTVIPFTPGDAILTNLEIKENALVSYN